MIEITSLDHNGKGIAKLNDKIVFVENSLPGEIVRLNIIKEKKKYIEAEVTEYIKVSDKRIESPCPYFKKCGGCDLLHIDYKSQLNFKQEKITNIINKYLNNKTKINNIVGCCTNEYYRNKTTFQVNKTVGFYKKNTYDITPIDSCLISSVIINRSIDKLKKLDLKYISKIICRSSDDELMIILDTNKLDINIEPIKNIASSIYIKNNDNYILKYGNQYITQKIGKYKYLISPDSFFQVNIDIAFKLYSKIKEYVGINNKVLDLYCGTGSIGIFVNENNKILGIELNKSAIKDAIKNVELNNITDIDFICGDSGKALYNLKINPDIIIVDPPRSGLSNETLKNILNFNSKKIIYVSCDPMTMVRDLNILKEKYNILELTPYDMFPNTKHLECLVLLEKAK